MALFLMAALLRALGAASAGGSHALPQLPVPSPTSPLSSTLHKEAMATAGSAPDAADIAVAAAAPRIAWEGVKHAADLVAAANGGRSTLAQVARATVGDGQVLTAEIQPSGSHVFPEPEPTASLAALSAAGAGGPAHGGQHSQSANGRAGAPGARAPARTGQPLGGLSGMPRPAQAVHSQGGRHHSVGGRFGDSDAVIRAMQAPVQAAAVAPPATPTTTAAGNKGAATPATPAAAAAAAAAAPAAAAGGAVAVTTTVATTTLQNASSSTTTTWIWIGVIVGVIVFFIVVGVKARQVVQERRARQQQTGRKSVLPKRTGVTV